MLHKSLYLDLVKSKYFYKKKNNNSTNGEQQ